MADIDDGIISNDAPLLRRVHPSQVIDDQNLHRKRPSSGTFRDKELSTDALTILTEDGLDWSFSLVGYQGYSLVKFLAAEVRNRGLPVIHKPLPQNRAHTEVHGTKSGKIATDLAVTCEWVHLEPKSDK